MNKSEERAYRWLQYQTHKGIVFRNRITPDFITEDSEKFEVKLMRDNTIWFSGNQFRTLLEDAPDTTILVFNDNHDTPIAIIPFSEIKGGEKYWKNIRIINGLTKPIKATLIKLSDLGWERLQQIEEEAKKLGLPVPSFIQLIIEQYFENKS